MNNKRFLLEHSDYDLKYEFSIADLSRIKKTKEDFWNEKEKCYMYGEFLNYLYEHNAFLTQEDADIVLNELYNKNEQLKSKLFDCQLELEHSKESVDNAYWELTEIKKENEQLRKDREDLFYRERDTKNEWRELHIENQIFRKFIELNDFDPNEIIRQGKGIE